MKWPLVVPAIAVLLAYPVAGSAQIEETPALVCAINYETQQYDKWIYSYPEVWHTWEDPSSDDPVRENFKNWANAEFPQYSNVSVFILSCDVSSLEGALNARVQYGTNPDYIFTNWTPSAGEISAAEAERIAAGVREQARLRAAAEERQRELARIAGEYIRAVASEQGYDPDDFCERLRTSPTATAVCM